MEQLSEKMKIALPLLISGQSIRDGCEKANISRDTFYRWLKNPAFLTEYTKMRGKLVSKVFECIDEAVTGAYKELSNLITPANEALRTLLNSPTEEIKLKAANAIWEHFLTMLEVAEISNQIQLIHRRLDDAGL